MDEQNTQTPTPDIEPATLGNLTQVHTVSPVSMVTSERPISASTVPDEPKKRRWPLILAITALSLLILLGASLAVFYFVFRTPDNEYDALLRNLRSMREDVKIIPKETQKVDEDYNVSEDNARITAGKSYVQKLEKVKSSKVLKKDSYVRAAYDNDKDVIEAYGQASIDAFETVAIHKKVTTACRSTGQDLDGVSTLRAYNDKVLICEKTMDENPHVPLKSFDESRHTKTIAAYKEIIEVFRNAYTAYEAKDNKKLDSLEGDIMKAYSNFNVATSGGETIENTKNPTYILDDMIKTAEKRKSVFFRE